VALHNQARQILDGANNNPLTSNLSDSYNSCLSNLILLNNTIPFNNNRNLKPNLQKTF